MGYMLETRGLTKRFGRGDQAQDAVADVSLHIREGEVYGLLGPNGAGKSTTLKMICGMLRPTAGEILFAGHAWRREDLYAIGSLIEEAPLYPNLTARENLPGPRAWGRSGWRPSSTPHARRALSSRLRSLASRSPWQPPPSFSSGSAASRTGGQMRRRPLAAVLALLSAALILGRNALLDAGWGSALRSIADCVLPNPEIVMLAPAAARRALDR